MQYGYHNKEEGMKKYWFVILGVLLLLSAACDKEKQTEKYNSYLQKPRYSEA